MISDRYRCIFVHIPRTAGSAIEEAISGRDWWFVNPLTKHLTARQARLLYGKRRWCEYFSFAFVRNPWDKLVSMWESNFYRRQRRKLRTFKEFVRDVNRNRFEQHTLHYHRILDLTPDAQLSPWDRFMRNQMGQAHVKFVGRFESLQIDMERVFAEIGIPAAQLPVLNRSEHRRQYREYYDDETIKIVADRFATDIKLFNYEF